MKNNIILFLALFLSYSSIAQNLHTLDKEMPCINKTFSLHLHVALDTFRMTTWTMDEMQAVVDNTNEAFAPMCAQFEICEVDTLVNWSWDSLTLDYRVQEINDLFYEENRINVFIVSRFSNPTLCGFANLGQIANTNSTNIYLAKGGCLSSLAHEMGHLFGLLHTFEGSGTELVNGSNCLEAGDLICDTPADPFVEGAEDTTWIELVNFEFIFDGLDDNGEYYLPDVSNVMSYYNAPSCGFTRGQFIKMANTWLEGNRKVW